MNNDDNFTRNSGDLSPELEARVVAWVLGEASAFEAAQLDVLCAAQPELVVFKRRLEAVHGLLGEAIKPLKTPLLLSPERRAKVLAVIGGDAPTVESVAAAPAKARKQARSWRGWVMPMAACFTMMALLAAVIIPTVGAVKRSSSRPGEVFENQQVEHRIVHFEAAPDRREVVDSSGSGSFALESRSEAKDNRESVGYDQMKASREPAMPTEPAPMVVFNKPQSAPGTTVGGVLASGAAAPVVSGFYSRDEERAVGTGAETGTASVASANWSAPPMPVFGFKSPTLNAPPAPEMKSPQSQALALDADQSALKLDGFAFADAPAGRLESVAGEVRRRKTPGSDLAADPFAAPVSGELGGRAVSADELDQAKLAAQGRSQYLAGDLAGAQETFRTLESVAPENAEANSFLGRISKEQAAVGEPNREKTRAQKPEEVASAWQRPGTYVDAKKTKAEQEAELLAKLDQVIIPQVNFNGVDMSRALSALTAVSEEADGLHSIRGVNIRLDNMGNPPPAINMTLRGLSLRRVLNLMTDSVGYRYEIQGNTIVVKPVDLTPSIQQQDLDKKIRAEIPTSTESVSTFSLHVSDASFRLAKAALERGQAPDPTTIRPEEFYNAFDYGDPSPAAGEAVSCRVEQAAHPFLQQRNLVRIAMKVPAAGRGAGQPLRLTVMLDTSGSMERDDRAATVRAALTALTSLLGPDDRVTLVGFARTPTLLAEGVPGDQAAKIIELAARTPAEGGTNLEEALALAGKLAMRQKLATAQNRIVLLTDGAANLGDADPQALAKRVEALRQNGIAFDACGVVADGLDDSVLEALTRKGDGRYAVVNSPEEADANFARQLAGAFRPAAKDVKVQVHFNPARVARYRLIGFEKHRLKTEDFRNDKIDAAELAAEEAAVAVYQVEVLPEGEGELGEVAVRFLDTRSNERVERSWTLAYSAQPAAFARATPSLQLAGSAAFLAEKLRGGALAGQVRLDEFAPVVEGLGAAYPNAPRVREFIQMFRQTRRLTGE